MYPDPAAQTQHSNRPIPWNRWGLIYMATSIGTLIALTHTAIQLVAWLDAALWSAWALFLALASLGSAAALIHARGTLPSPRETLKLALYVPLRLATYLVPGVLFLKDPYSGDTVFANSLPRRHILALMAVWSVWGLLCGCLGGLHAKQTTLAVMFGAIFIVPALFGWARYAGMVE